MPLLTAKKFFITASVSRFWGYILIPVFEKVFALCSLSNFRMSWYNSFSNDANTVFL